MDAATQKLEANDDLDTLLYRVRPGDSLTGLLKRYHPRANSERLQSLASEVTRENPDILHPDSISPGQLIQLRVPSQYCAPVRPFQQLHTIRASNTDWVKTLKSDWHKSTSEERTTMSALLPAFMNAGNNKLSMIDTTLSTNTPLLNEMINNYENFKAGQKTKGQYDYQRRQLVERFKKNLGPTNLLVSGTQPPTEVLRISRKKGHTPTEPISKQLRKMQSVARITKSGTVALSVVGLGITCHQIGQAKRRDEKNEILVESVGAIFGGIMYGITSAIGLAFLATPVGWVASLVIGAGGLATGYLFGQGTKELYNATGNKIDFVREFGVNSVCPSSRPQSRRKSPILSGQTLAVL